MCWYKRASAWLLVITLLVSLCLVSACGSTPVASQGVLQVVAAENFYGDIVRQLGGDYINVTSVLSDPNVDPHTYQANVQTGLTVSKANLVIENGGGFDDWMDHILASSPNSARLVIKAFDVTPEVDKLPDNEHVWYSLTGISTVAQEIAARLKQLDPTHADAFTNNLHTFQQSLQPLQQKIALIKAKFLDTPVGLTETIFLYQIGPAGLKVITPLEFQEAIAEDNDPPAETVITATNQINHGEIKVLIYNGQTESPITANLKKLATEKGIPVVAVTETLPAGKTYQDWMLGQLTALETALGG